MVIVYLKGGLGNQMFQYALSRHLAEIHKTELKLDISAYDYDGPLEYFLGNFNTIQNFACEEEVKKLKHLEQSGFQKRLHNLFHSHQKVPKTFIRWNKSSFNPAVLNLPNNVYIEGYWNSEKYFVDIADIIRREFSVKIPLSERNKELAETIGSAQSVSIHIRRGDYILDEQANKTHGMCGLDYYHSCVEHLAGAVGEPHFFIFSDDPAWCRNNLQLPYSVTFVSHNDMRHSYEDLRLMTLCKHNIIANSTFSWWGAWLNPNKDKMVFAPQKWFNNRKKKKYSSDIVPLQWIRK